MINPLYWPRYQRTRRAIADYPLYEVPHRQAEGTLAKSQIDENFAYFMSVRLQRLSFFQKWLRDKYGVKAPLTGDGVLALEEWADRYSGGLVSSCDVSTSSHVFTTYQPRWTDVRCGYNVLVDIAMFIGEFLIARRPNLNWALLTNENGSLTDGEEGEPHGTTNGRPALSGFSLDNWRVDLFETSYLEAVKSRNIIELGGNRQFRVHVSLAWVCRESLHLASHRDPRATFTFGDYSHGPL